MKRKDLTPLEALEDLRNYLDFVKTEKFSKTNLVRYFNEKFDIIETALKDSEWYKQKMIKFEKAFTEENEEKLKLKKVLEIIVKKGFDVGWLKRKFREGMLYEDYADANKYNSYFLTQEQFDLLKEVLK